MGGFRQKNDVASTGLARRLEHMAVESGNLNLMFFIHKIWWLKTPTDFPLLIWGTGSFSGAAVYPVMYPQMQSPGDLLELRI